jgi:hypothetical protein
MRCFGRDTDCVGVNGIETCMGIFLATDEHIYAFHITSGTENADKQGIHQFVEYILGNEPHFNPDAARLYGVMNADKRPNGVDLLNLCAERLGVSQCKPVKLTDLPKTMSGRAAAAVLCRRVGAEIQLMYKQNDSVTWTAGGGTARGGYHGYALEDDTRLSTDIDETWRTVGNGWGGWGWSCVLF